MITDTQRNLPEDGPTMWHGSLHANLLHPPSTMLHHRCRLAGSRSLASRWYAWEVPDGRMRTHAVHPAARLRWTEANEAEAGNPVYRNGINQSAHLPPRVESVAPPAGDADTCDKSSGPKNIDLDIAAAAAAAYTPNACAARRWRRQLAATDDLSPMVHWWVPPMRWERVVDSVIHSSIPVRSTVAHG